MNNIKRGNLNYDQSGRAYPDNPEVNENWNCIWENNGKYYKLVGDDYHKEWEEVDIFNQIIHEVYENWCKQFEVDPNNFNVDELVKGHGDQCWGYPVLDHVKPTSKEYKRGQINAYLEGKAEKPFFYLTKEEFINKCKTDSEFSETWGLKIEERELSKSELNILYNIRRGVGKVDTNYSIGTVKSKDPSIPTKLITITYNNETIESYE
jgi:hypothetical protein